MDYLTLNNNIKMPLIGLGTWDLRGQECIDAIITAIQLGYRLIDTAQMYENEKEVGIAIKQSGVDRKELFITTKIYRISNSYEKAKEAINQSLKDLQLDYIDLLLLHEPYKQGPQMYQALEEAYQEGKVKSIGISNYNEKWYQGFLNQCKIMPMINQVETHIEFQKWDLQEMMKQHGTLMQAWSPLGQGSNEILNHPLLKQIGQKYNKTPAQIALKFLVQRGISIIPKTNKEVRLKENIDLFDFTLTNTEINEIKKLDKNKTYFPWTEAF